ncbi:MAG TPA: hypothetical protein VF399_08765 [bacterium]
MIIKNMKDGRKLVRYCLLAMLVMAACASNILGARYYRLLEQERSVFLGLRSIDTTFAMEYLNTPSAADRRFLYDSYWRDKDSARMDFEERTMYAFRTFGANAPLSDERLSTYVKYGPPSRRQEISPQKLIMITAKEVVRPAEIWSYRSAGLEFDFIRIARAYKILVKSEFGDAVKLPYLKEDTIPVPASFDSVGVLDYSAAIGRFRQKMNLTRLELYINVPVKDTTGLKFCRMIKVFNDLDSLISEKEKIVYPQNGDSGIFCDQSNFWLEPKVYRITLELADLKNKLVGREEFTVDLLEYAADAKEISDLIAARLIDESFTDERFSKPVGRVIPMTQAATEVNVPFYFYHELYNLQTSGGRHQLRTTYEIYSKERMKREILDVLIQDESGEGDIAYLPAKYHPMDLPAGNYIVVARDTDLLSGKEKTAVSEFELLSRKNIME